MSHSSLPTIMRAFVLHGHGDMDQLTYHTDWPVPEIGEGELLVKVLACGLNNTDINTRTAWYSKSVSKNTTGSKLDEADDDDAAWGGTAITFPRIQGADVAGIVVAAGPGADNTLIGKRVLIDTWLRDWDNPMIREKCGYYGSECDGGFAEYTAINQHNVHAVESDLGNAELATFATAFVTAENMLNRANVGAGDTVLIPGASGGVGSALIQLANRRGAKTIAMTSAAKIPALADHDILSPTDIIAPPSRDGSGDLAAALMKAIGRNNVSVIADVVGGDLWPDLIGVLERGGRYTCAGAIAGPMVDFDLRTFYLRDLTFTGATIVPPGVFADLVGYIERGEIKPVLAAQFDLTELHSAQQAFIDKKHIGNIVVTVGS